MQNSNNTPPSTYQNLSAIENLIKGYLADITSLRDKLKAQKEMLRDTVEQDKDYSEVAEKQSAVKKEVAKAKEVLKKNDSYIATQMKADEISEELKACQTALSDYLNQYIALTNTSEFVGPDGEVLSIVRSAKLVKKK
jgi:Skp family chaperone for outer membrane proteins